MGAIASSGKLSINVNFEPYFIFFCTSLSFLYSGGWVYAAVYNFVLWTCCSLIVVVAITDVLPMCAAQSMREPFKMLLLLVVICSFCTTLVLSTQGWFGPVAGSEAIGFYFLDEATVVYGMSRFVPTWLRKPLSTWKCVLTDLV